MEVTFGLDLGVNLEVTLGLGLAVTLGLGRGITLGLDLELCLGVTLGLTVGVIVGVVLGDWVTFLPLGVLGLAKEETTFVLVFLGLSVLGLLLDFSGD